MSDPAADVESAIAWSDIGYLKQAGRELFAVAPEVAVVGMLCLCQGV